MKKLQVQHWFLIISVFFGVLYAIITPPFQVIDEVNHFYRAYQVSEGGFVTLRENQRLGGYIPKNIDSFANCYIKLKLNPYDKIRPDFVRQTTKIKLQAQNKVFKDYSNTALYSPVSYIPQAFAIFILRKCNVRPYYMLISARIFSLIVWVVILFFVIHIVPVHKYLFAFLALLPMSLTTAASMSADVVTNAISFMFIALVFKIAIDENEIPKGKIIILILLAMLLGTAKMVYLPLVFLFFLIPVAKSKSVRRYVITFAIIAIAGIATSVLWKIIIDNLYIPYPLYNAQFRNSAALSEFANMQKQLEFMNLHKFGVAKIFIKSFFRELPYLFGSYPAAFGWNDTQFPTIIVILIYFSIFVIACHEKYRFSLVQKNIMIGVFVVSTLLIMLSMYLLWDDVGSNRVYPLQGKYFIPLLPLLFVMINRRLLPLKIGNYGYMVFCISLAISLLAALHITKRFYYNYSTQTEWQNTYTCEEKDDQKNNYFINKSDTLIYSDMGNVSNEMAYSGKTSVKLTHQNQFGFTHRIFGTGKGDILKVSVWRYGNKGDIVFSDFSGGHFYYGSSKVFEKNKNGWEYLQSEFFVPRNMTHGELRVYIWYTGTDSAYFDNFKITWLKRIHSN